jgi:hypothetical protein
MDLRLESPMKVNTDIVILIKVLLGPNQSFLQRIRLLENIRIIALRLNSGHVANVENVGDDTYNDNESSKLIDYLAEDLIEELLSQLFTCFLYEIFILYALVIDWQLLEPIHVVNI